MVRGEGRIGKKNVLLIKVSQIQSHNLSVHNSMHLPQVHKCSTRQEQKKRPITLVKIKLKKVTEVDYRTTNSHH